MAESPLMALMDALGEIPLEQWREYCEQHPPTPAICETCGNRILSTPWFAPSGTCHLTGWMHEATESSSCGKDFPYKFAEPA